MHLPHDNSIILVIVLMLILIILVEVQARHGGIRPVANGPHDFPGLVGEAVMFGASQVSTVQRNTVYVRVKSAESRMPSSRSPPRRDRFPVLVNVEAWRWKRYNGLPVAERGVRPGGGRRPTCSKPGTGYGSLYRFNQVLQNCSLHSTCDVVLEPV